MNNELQTFEFQSHQLTVIVDEHGEPWFIAMEVAEILEYSDANKMTSKLDEDEVQNRQIGGFGNRGVNLINESGLWSSVLRSTKPEAKAVKKWLTSEVLPSIRKTGGYGTPDFLTPITEPISLEDFNQRHRILTEAFINLKNAQVVAVMTGAEAIATAQRQSKPAKSVSTLPATSTRNPRRNRHWTEVEIATLRDYYNQGMKYADIAEKMGRSCGSVAKAVQNFLYVEVV